MKITRVIEILTKILAKDGDIECQADCPQCGHAFPVGLVETRPPTVRLK